MLKNVFAAFFRKIGKSDVYSLINLVGLAIGITACLLIFLFVSDELRYDKHHGKADRIYRMLVSNPRTMADSPLLPAVYYPLLEERIPGVEQMARLFYLPEVVLGTKELPLTEQDLVLADPSLLQILDVTFMRGNPETALSEPNSLLLTPEAALRYFGQEDPMGQSLQLENTLTFTVTGIIEPMPSQSHLQFKLLGTLETMRGYNPGMFTDWGNSAVYFYFLLHAGADPGQVSHHIQEVIWDARETFRDLIRFPLQPLLDIRLHSSHLEWEQADIGNHTMVMVFSAVAVLILALACFNFVNLSVAMSVRRAREIGIRKVMGASRAKLISQFIAETFVLALFATGLALLLAELLMPALNRISGKELSLSLFSDPALILFLLSILVVVSLLAGTYPSLIMSRFKAIEAMRGGQVISTVKGISGKRYAFGIRQLLMMLQFAVSTALIISSLMIHTQLRHLTNRHPGYEAEGLMAIHNPWDEQASSRALWLKNQFLQIPEITGVSLAHNIPPVKPNNYSNFAFTQADGEEQRFHGAIISVDADYFSTLGTRLISGRDFSTELTTDAEASAIINATAAARWHQEDPIGARLRGFYDNEPRQVIGVVEDIHFASMHETVGPTVFIISDTSYPQNWFKMVIRYRTDAEEAILGLVNDKWQETAPHWPLRHYFVEERFLADYQDDRRTRFMVTAFAILAIILSVLGLIGLALYSAATRTREIGIRKVLGASVMEITRLISNEFGILVLLSNLLAWPAAYLFLDRWLDHFAYRADIHWLVFLLPALGVYLIAMLTVGIITRRAASCNPVDTLRSNE